MTIKIRNTKWLNYCLIKKYIRIIYFFSALLLLCNCHHTTEYEGLIREWYGKKIIIPDNLKSYKNSINSFNSKKYKIVSFINGSCPSCLSELKQWDSLKIDSNTNRIANSLFFIISTNDEIFLQYYLESNNINFSCFNDYTNTFIKINNIPENRLFQTFLLDSYNKVKLIGNPLYNKNLMEIYLKELSTNN